MQKTLPSLITRRGCFPSVYHEGYLYCFGGLNYTDKIMKKCERICLIDDAEGVKHRWHEVADMKEFRKNASACSITSDTIYVFGGSSNNQVTLDSIE